jgi:hypothetical protein
MRHIRPLFVVAATLILCACGGGTSTEDLAGRPEACGMYRCGFVENTDCGNCEHLSGMFRSGDYACNSLGYCIQPGCGNGIPDKNEICEPGMTIDCSALDYDHFVPGVKSFCGPSCDWDRSNCIARDLCGNGTVDENEVCERSSRIFCTLLDPAHYLAGTAYCSSDCSGWYTNGCVTADICGNYLQDIGEVCDTPFSKPCVDFGDEYVSGRAFCRDDCSGWSFSKCVLANICGNGVVENDEFCDGSGKRCIYIDEKYDEWDTAPCRSDCSSWDLSYCHIPAVCGDGVVDPSTEECEKGQTLACLDIDPQTYLGGTATCNTTCTAWNVSSCVLRDVCGNGIQESGEECDTNNSIPCVEIDPEKYTGGTSYCNDDCTGWDLSTCVE